MDAHQPHGDVPPGISADATPFCPGPAGDAPSGSACPDPQPDAPACAVCTEPIVHAALGVCGHAAACAHCCLKMRLNYGNTKCPVCNVNQPVVSLLPWQRHFPVDPKYLVDDARLRRALEIQHHRSVLADGVYVFKTEGCGLAPPLCLSVRASHVRIMCLSCSRGVCVVW